MRDSELFRKNALKSFTKRIEGEVLLTEEPSYIALIILLTAFIGVFVAFFSLASFNKFETAQGMVITKKGQLKVFPKEASLVEELFVEEGEKVKKGQRLLALRTQAARQEGNSTKELEREEILKQLDNLQSLQKTINVNSNVRKNIMLKELEGLEKKLTIVEIKYRLKLKNLELAESLVKTKEGLYKQGSLSEKEVHDSEIDLLNAQLLVQDLIGNMSDLKSQGQILKDRINAIPNEALESELEIKNEIAKAQRQLLSINDSISAIVEAAKDGYVTNISAREGELVSVKFPILTITPTSPKYIVELYVPARSIGFVKKDLSVKVRFEAFPVEIYKDLEGVVEDVSKTILFPNEWDNPLNLNVPVYRVKVNLSNQHIQYNGEKIKLKPGLRVSADIILERQTIFESILAPILSINSTLH